jgi:hypothetical protein
LAISLSYITLWDDDVWQESSLPSTVMHHYAHKTRDAAFTVLPRKQGGGGGGFGSGVAPHAGYDQTPSVLGMATPYLPPALDSISTKNLCDMRRACPVEFA